MAAETSPEDQAAATALSERLQSDDNEIVKAAMKEYPEQPDAVRKLIKATLKPIFGAAMVSPDFEFSDILTLKERSDAGDARAMIRLTMLPAGTRFLYDQYLEFHEKRGEDDEATRAMVKRLMASVFPKD